MAKKTLSEKRYVHTKNVKKMAVKLAIRYGQDPEKAALAALLHDICKELSREQMLQIMGENAIISGNAETRPAPVWHGVCAAIVAQKEWGITDPQVLSAIACHTTGKAGMGMLDKILFLADMTSAERDWPGVEHLRALAMQDIDLAMIEALVQTIDFVMRQGKPVDPVSQQALADLRRTYYGGKTAE